ncbi:MAG: YdeI/OmpD-associated family protein [Methanomassiliicoccus sp.]|nr:YdeI/OmpD-associated family protein [Methanomassiliicoccus sp.]
MPSVIDTYGTIHPRDRKEWRMWLKENHDRSPGIWIVYFKKASGKQGLSPEEAVEEALCFGWIDSQAGSVDGERYRQVFSPRRKRSNWSSINKQRAERLIEQGLMTPAGMAKIKEAKADGSWDGLKEIDDLVVPEDLAQVLLAEPEAERCFHSLSAAKRKQLLWYLKSAKRAETRGRRIAEIVRLAIDGGSAADLSGRKKES